MLNIMTTFLLNLLTFFERFFIFIKLNYCMLVTYYDNKYVNEVLKQKFMTLNYERGDIIPISDQYYTTEDIGYFFYFFFNIEVFLAFSILIFVLMPFFINYFNDNSNINITYIYKQLLICVLLFSILLLSNIFFITFYFYNLSYMANSFVNFFKMLILIFLLFMFIVLNIEKKKKKKNVLFFPYGINEFFIMVLFNVLGLFFFISAENLLLVYLGLELHSLTLALMFGLRYFVKYSTEAALKYFIISSFSSSIFLLGASFLYGVFGTIDFQNLLYLVTFNFEGYLLKVAIMAMVLIIVSILIKLGTAPFHMWSVDVYEGAATFVTLYALVIPKIIYIGFFVKMIFYFQVFNFVFFFLFKYCGLFSILLGTIGALIQTKIKRVFSYSAIANFGYILLALSTGTMDGIITSLFFLVTYAIVTCGVFFILLGLISIIDNSEIKTIFQLRTLVYSGNEYIAIFLSIFLFALSSLPPFNIFVSKFFLIFSIVEGYDIFSFFSIFVILLSNILSCFYYIRMIRLIFFSSRDEKLCSIPYKRRSFASHLVISFFSFCNIFLFVYPQLLLDFLEYIFIYENLELYSNKFSENQLFILQEILTKDNLPLGENAKNIFDIFYNYEETFQTNFEMYNNNYDNTILTIIDNIMPLKLKTDDIVPKYFSLKDKISLIKVVPEDSLMNFEFYRENFQLWRHLRNPKIYSMQYKLMDLHFNSLTISEMCKPTLYEYAHWYICKCYELHGAVYDRSYTKLYLNMRSLTAREEYVLRLKDYKDWLKTNYRIP